MQTSLTSRRNRLVAATAITLSALAPAHAAFTGGSASFSELASPPAAVKNGSFKNNTTLFGFDEKSVTLGKKLSLDLGLSGSSFLATGTQIASHYLTFDPKNKDTWSGYVTFDHDILGVIYKTGQLKNSNSLLGLTSVNYTGASGIETSAGDMVTIKGNRLDLTLFDSSSDSLRVITSVPEPSTYAMIGAGLMCVGFMTRRRLG